ncbi:Spore germination GerPB [Paenibacillus sp. UNC499MF]|nr:Spore germination GerPB [Paenibacillus sp. UNC499MF]
MSWTIHQTITIHQLRVDAVSNSSVLQVGSAGSIRALSNQYNTGGFTAPAPEVGKGSLAGFGGAAGGGPPGAAPGGEPSGTAGPAGQGAPGDPAAGPGSAGAGAAAGAGAGGLLGPGPHLQPPFPPWMPWRPPQGRGPGRRS